MRNFTTFIFTKQFSQFLFLILLSKYECTLVLLLKWKLILLIGWSVICVVSSIPRVILDNAIQCFLHHWHRHSIFNQYLNSCLPCVLDVSSSFWSIQFPWFLAHHFLSRFLQFYSLFLVEVLPNYSLLFEAC